MQRFNINWTAKALVNQMEKGKVNYDNAVQRNLPCLTVFQQLARHNAIQFVVSEAGRKRFTDEMIAMQLYQLVTEECPDFSTKPFREWASKVEVDSDVLDTINAGLDAYMVFARSLIDVNNKVLRTVKGRTHFISCAYYCCLAVENGVSQDEINRTLTEFFSGHPSISPEYNRTVSAGSAKPTSVQTRRDVMRSLLPATVEEES